MSCDELVSMYVRYFYILMIYFFKLNFQNKSSSMSSPCNSLVDFFDFVRVGPYPRTRRYDVAGINDF